MRPQEKIFEALRKWVRLRASAAKRANGAAHRDLYIGTIMSQPKDTSRLKHTKKKSPPLATSDDRSKAAPQYVVGLGASAGGLEALERFFKAMPEDSGMAFVVIQHLSPDFKSLMDELLARFTKMHIQRVTETAAVRPNTVYLLPPRKEMTIVVGQLLVQDKPTDQPLNMPINVFFRSLARDQGDKAIAIVLSGTGTDASAGLLDIHDLGGLILVQDTESAKFDGMPRSAVATGLADAVLAPENMPAALLAYAKNPRLPLAGADPAKSPAELLAGIPAVVEKLREVYDVDFNFYKPGTISRRLDRRVSFGHSASIEEYSQRVLQDPAELDSLYKDLLIGVTRFFRDPEAYELIEKKIIPQILDAIPPDEEIRVWVAGCATGEEAYSLGILFLEACAARQREPNLKLFASDVHRESLHFAAEGCYPEASVVDLPKARIEAFFTEEVGPGGEKLFRVAARLRKLLIFSPHNLIKDPPFTRIDLVSCRNLLIYFQPIAQTKALASFHFALKLKGFLLLGPSEGTAELQNEFEAIDRHWKLFRKVHDTRLPMELRLNLTPNVGRSLRPGMPGDLRLARAYEALLNRYVPTGVLVNDRREILHVFGEADRYLRPNPGRMNNDVVNMARGDLRIALSSAIQNALKKAQRVAFKGVEVGEEGNSAKVDVIAEPISDKVTSATYLLVLFEPEKAGEQPAPVEVQTFELNQEARARIQQLEGELQHTKESLQTTVEELETSNEELQASNEELLASNEELQSTNEELHSVNEELYSVNAEHEQKIRELDEATSDLKNLVQSTDIGIIFTDEQQRIRLFTPRAAEVLNLMAQDVGRDIKHITSRIKDDDLFAEIDEATRLGKPREKKVTLPNGHSYLRRIRPYLDVNKVASGLILSLVDVTELDAAERQFRLMVEGAPQAVVMCSAEGRIVHFNPAAEKSFGYPRSEIIGQNLENLLPERLRTGHRQMRHSFAKHPTARPMAGRQLIGRRKDGSEFPIEIGISPVHLQEQLYVVAFITDITLRRQMEDERDRIERKMTETQKLESLGVLAGGIAHDFNNLLAGIIGNNSLALMDLPADSPARDYLISIRETAQRAAELCKQMLAYSGRGRFVVEQCDLSHLVEETTQLLQVSISKKVVLRFNLSHDLPPVMADLVQIRQVIMNLVINASEAIGDVPGVINITTQKFQADGALLAQATHPAEVAEGDYVLLEIQDSGCGIKPEDLPRIFEPFFSTKFTGRGLGLAAVLGIVRGHKGAIICQSQPGRGTSFKLLLPPSAPGETPPTHQSRLEEQNWRGSGTVLLVDDEESVRTSASRMLKALGFDTVVAADGDEAVTRYAASPNAFCLVLLDFTMPRLNGAQAFSEIRKINPEARVILMSGFNESEASSGLTDQGLAAFLQKPFDIDAFRRVLRKVLG